jgi:hypothetical protein
MVVNGTLPKGRKINQNHFISSILPWFDESEAIIYTEKLWRRLPAPYGQFCMLQWPKDHGLIDKCQHHTGFASHLLARPESLRFLAVWIPEGINEGVE